MYEISKINGVVGDELTRFKSEFSSKLSHSNPLLNSVLCELGKRSGKSMRPLLLLLCSKLLGRVEDTSIYAACAIEYLHTASLLHDDVVDESDKRRGKQSINTLYTNNVAVLVGDYLLGLSLDFVSCIDDNRIIKTISKASRSLANGELMQLNNLDTKTVSESNYLDIIYNKTAALFEACGACAALILGCSDDVVERFSKFGKLVGMIFQIRDDIFDYYDDAIIGKPTGNDMREGKLTLPGIYAVSQSTDTKLLELPRKVFSGEITSDEVSYFIEKSKELGGIKYSEECMRRYAEEAKALLSDFPDNSVRKALFSYIDFEINRSL
jgi:octaprenyl-diphosphate synthase